MSETNRRRSAAKRLPDPDERRVGHDRAAAHGMGPGQHRQARAAAFAVRHHRHRRGLAGGRREAGHRRDQRRRRRDGPPHRSGGGGRRQRERRVRRRRASCSTATRSPPSSAAIPRPRAKALLPVLARSKGLLYYPTYYEGQEQDARVLYPSQEATQSVIAAVEWMAREKGKNFFLVGSDYIYPRTCNKIAKPAIARMGAKVVGEEYAPLGHTEFSSIINKIKAAKPECIYSTVVGGSNVAFYSSCAPPAWTARAWCCCRPSCRKTRSRASARTTPPATTPAWATSRA